MMAIHRGRVWTAHHDHNGSRTINTRDDSGFRPIDPISWDGQQRAVDRSVASLRAEIARALGIHISASEASDPEGEGVRVVASATSYEHEPQALRDDVLRVIALLTVKHADYVSYAEPNLIDYAAV